MIFGIGTDLCAADRMAAKLQKPAFVQRVFSPAEQALLNERGGTHRAETAAANFAAKEAILKAAGTGLGGFALTDLTVLRKESGAPYFALTGPAAEWIAANALTPHLSLTHENGLACAPYFVTIGKEVRRADKSPPRQQSGTAAHPLHAAHHR